MSCDDRRTLRVTLFSQDGDFRIPLAEAAEMMRAMLAKVPPEFRGAAFFEVEMEHDYYGGSSSVTTSAYYDRAETDAEMARRHAEQSASEAAARAHNEANERRIYEQLRAKFG